MCVNRDDDWALTRTNCMTNNVGYQGKCSRWDGTYTYIGKTSRTIYKRGKEHLDNYRFAAAVKLPLLPVENTEQAKPEC